MWYLIIIFFEWVKIKHYYCYNKDTNCYYECEEQIKHLVKNILLIYLKSLILNYIKSEFIQLDLYNIFCEYYKNLIWIMLLSNI